MTVTYDMKDGYDMERTHLYVGEEKLPRNKWDHYTTAPGQYPYQHDPTDDAGEDTYVITGVSGPIYVVAHADVCWFR